MAITTSIAPLTIEVVSEFIGCYSLRLNLDAVLRAYYRGELPHGAYTAAYGIA
jgi:hypothetical protein